MAGTVPTAPAGATVSRFSAWNTALVPNRARSRTHDDVLDRAHLERLARDQHGLVTLAQCLDAGASPSGWYRQHRSGVLVPVHRGVSRLDRAPVTPVQTVLGAALATKGVVSHATAARLWGASIPPGPVDVTLLDRAGGRRPAGACLHRPVDLRDLGTTRLYGVPVTGPVRTALDIGAVGDPAVVAVVVEHFLAARLVTRDELHLALERHGRQGRSGLRALRAALGVRAARSRA